MRKQLSVIRSQLNLITFIDISSDNRIQCCFTYFCNSKELIIKKKDFKSSNKTIVCLFFKAELPKASAILYLVNMHSSVSNESKEILIWL